MRQAARIRWNSLFSLLSSGIRLLTNFLLFFGLARIYGPEAFGQFTTAHTLATLFLLLADFGLDLLLTTEVARQRENASRLFPFFFSAKLLFACLATVAMCLMGQLHGFSAGTRELIYVFSLSIIFSALANSCFALLKGFEELHHETRVAFFANFVLLVLLVLLGILRASISWFAAAFIFTRALTFVLAVWVAQGYVRLQMPPFNWIEWRVVLRQSWVFGVYFLFGTLFFQLDTLLLALWQGDHAVGLYQSVMKLVALVLMLPDVANSAFLPVLSRLHAESAAQWAWLCRLLNKTLWLLGLPAALVFFVYAEKVLQRLYGSNAFTPAAPIMRVAAFIVLLRFAWEAYGIMLTTSGRQFVKMAIVVAATVIALACNAYAIPRYGAMGAIGTSLLVSLFVAAAFAWHSRPFSIRWTCEARYVLSGALTAVLGLVFYQTTFLNFWYALPAALASYALICYFVGYAKEERRLVFSMGRK